MVKMTFHLGPGYWSGRASKLVPVDITEKIGLDLVSLSFNSV